MQQMRSGCNGRGVGGVVVPVRVGVAPYERPCCCKGVVAAAARTATGVLLLLLLMLAALAFDRSDHSYLVRPSISCIKLTGEHEAKEKRWCDVTDDLVMRCDANAMEKKRDPESETNKMNEPH